MEEGGCLLVTFDYFKGANTCVWDLSFSYYISKMVMLDSKITLLQEISEAAKKLETILVTQFDKKLEVYYCLTKHNAKHDN